MADEQRGSWALVPQDRVLVTGAAGFIGSALTRELCGRDVHVVALVEPGADRQNLDGLGVEEITADLRDAAAVAKAADGCRAVFHVAALYRFWARDPESFYAINVEGTRNVLAGRVGPTANASSTPARSARSG